MHKHCFNYEQTLAGIYEWTHNNKEILLSWLQCQKMLILRIKIINSYFCQDKRCDKVRKKEIQWLQKVWLCNLLLTDTKFLANKIQEYDWNIFIGKQSLSKKVLIGKKNSFNDKKSKFDAKTASIEFCLDWDFARIFKSIWMPKAWILLIFLYHISFYSSFCRLFFLPWMASIGHNLDKFWFAFWEKVFSFWSS